MYIYIVNGAPGSGKTTFENIIKEILPDDYCKILSTIDPIKEVARKLGWNGEKTPKDRKFLSDLKDLCTEWGDVSFKYIKKQLNSIEKSFEVYDMTADKVIVFIDSREPDEIERFRKELGAKAILIRRPSGAEKEISNHADKDVENVIYDLIIDNVGSLADLKNSCEFFLDDVYYGHKKTQ